jgi:uncharacterized protein (DUF2345 family)
MKGYFMTKADDIINQAQKIVQAAEDLADMAAEKQAGNARNVAQDQLCRAGRHQRIDPRRDRPRHHETRFQGLTVQRYT